MDPIDHWIQKDNTNQDTWTEGYSIVGNFCFDNWGDGIVNSKSQSWDDGNLSNGDGCSSNCKVEDGYACSLDSSNKSSWYRSWGDEIKSRSEKWDDGNLNDGDGWSISCLIESGFVWDTSKDPNYWYKSWGDGIKDTSEQWDDGNSDTGDGCDQSWVIESGFQWNTLVSPNFWYPQWGNGVRDPGEQWDDNNSMNYDGWSSDCKIEENYQCTYNPGIPSDKWVSKFYPPTISKSSVNSQTSQIEIDFNESMSNYSFNGTEVSLSVESSSWTYELSWSLSFTSPSQLIIKYSVSPLLIGGNEESIILNFVNVDAFKSEKGIPISTQYKIQFSLETVEASEGVNQANSGAAYILILTFVLSIGVSVVTGQSMELMWALAHTLQILFF